MAWKQLQRVRGWDSLYFRKITCRSGVKASMVYGCYGRDDERWDVDSVVALSACSTSSLSHSVIGRWRRADSLSHDNLITDEMFARLFAKGDTCFQPTLCRRRPEHTQMRSRCTTAYCRHHVTHNHNEQACDERLIRSNMMQTGCRPWLLIY